MKKRVLFLLLVLSLLLAGCGKAPKKDEPLPTEPEPDSFEPMPGFDAQNKYLIFNGLSFQETDNFYFGCGMHDAYQHFYDRKTGISGYLCADPACGHDTKDCSAYTGSFTTLTYYDGKFYWVGLNSEAERDKYLLRCDLSGTNREKVKKISFEDITLTYQPQQYAIHRGKLYIIGKTGTVEGAAVGYRLTLLSSPLDSSEEFTVLYDEIFECAVSPAFRFVGNRVYFYVDSVSSDGIRHLTVIKYDAGTGEAAIAYEEADVPDIISAFWVTQEGEIYFSGFDGNREYIYLWKLEDGKRVEAAFWKNEKSDPPMLMDGIVVWVYVRDGARRVDIADFAGETIHSGELLPDKVEGLTGNPNTVGLYGIAFTGGDAEKLILHLDSINGDESATVLVDLTDNMKATLLWSSED